MNEDILQGYKNHLRQEYRKKNTVNTFFSGISLFLEYIEKPLEEITLDDLKEWKIQINEKHRTNTIRTWIVSVNMFFSWHGKPELKLRYPSQQRAQRIIFSNDERDRFLEEAEKDPLHNVVALGLYDLILRPNELIDIKISNIDFTNHKIYLKDAKTGDATALMSPRFEKAVQEYLKVRLKPHPEFVDYLIINPNTNGYRQKYKSTRGILRITKQIGLRAGIRKNVTPYKTVKPSAITLRFNEQVNPRTIQRLARHSDIKVTMIYDHSADNDALAYLRKQYRNVDYEKLTPQLKAELLLDEYFKGKMDKTNFQQCLDVLKPEIKRDERNDIGYV